MQRQDPLYLGAACAGFVCVKYTGFLTKSCSSPLVKGRLRVSRCRLKRHKAAKEFVYLACRIGYTDSLLHLCT